MNAKVFNFVSFTLVFSCLLLPVAGAYEDELKDREFEQLLLSEIRLDQQWERMRGNTVDPVQLYHNKSIDPQELSLWYRGQKDFLRKYDVFVQEEQDFFIERSYKNMNQLLSSLDFRILKKAENEISEMRQRYEDYHRYRSGFGTSKDYRRIRSYVLYFSACKNVLDRTGFYKKAAKPWQKYLKKRIVKKGINHLDLFKEVWFPKKRKSPDQPLTKLMLKEREALLDVYKPLGLHVSIEGIENIPPQYTTKLPDERTVNIFAYMHGNSLLDELIKAHIRLPHFMVVWAVAAGPMPKFMKKALEKSPSIVAVGSGKDTTTLALDRLNKRYTNNIAIHPQGEENLFNEVMPLHSNFSDKFVRKIREAGYRVNIIPVTSIYHPNFINGKIDEVMATEESRKIRVLIHPPVTDTALARMYGMENGTDILNTVIRSVWMHHSVTDDFQIAGMMRPGPVYDRMEGILGELIHDPEVAKNAVAAFANKPL